MTCRVARQTWGRHLTIIYEDGRNSFAAKEPITEAFATRVALQLRLSTDAQTATVIQTGWEKETIARLRLNLLRRIPHGSAKICNVLLAVRIGVAWLWESQLSAQLVGVVLILHDVHRSLDVWIERRGRATLPGVQRAVRFGAIRVQVRLVQLADELRGKAAAATGRPRREDARSQFGVSLILGEARKEPPGNRSATHSCARPERLELVLQEITVVYGSSTTGTAASKEHALGLGGNRYGRDDVFHNELEVEMTREIEAPLRGRRRYHRAAVRVTGAIGDIYLVGAVEVRIA